MKKKGLSILLASAMVAAMLTGCGNDGGQSSGSSEASDSGSAADSGAAESEASDSGEEASDAGAADSGEVPTITYAHTGKASADMEIWPPDFVKQMEEDLGVKIEVIQITDEQFDLAVASGDATFDIANVTKYREPQVLNKGMAVCLDDYLDIAPNIAKFEDRNNLVREFLSNGDGKLYFTRCQVGPEFPGSEIWSGYVVRWDWYKELGCPPINSDEDYLNVLQQMVEAHPTNDAGGPTYGLGQYVGTGLWSWNVVKTYQLGYSENYVPGLQVNLATGDVYNAYTDDEASFWQAMEFFNKAYNMGLCDPDFFIMKSDDLNTKVVQGTYAGALRTWDVGSYYSQEAKNDPETLKGYVSVFPENGGMSANYASNPIAGWENNSLFVYSGCKNIDKAVQVLDYMHNEDNLRTYYSGFEGVHWEYDENNVPVLTDAGKEMFATGGTPLDQAGVAGSTTGGWMNYLCAYSGGVMHSDGSMLNLTYSPEALAETLNPLQKDYSAHYNVSYPAQVHQNQVEQGIAKDRSMDTKDLYMILTQVPEDMGTKKTQIETLLEGYIPDLVMAATAEEYQQVKEQVIEECKAMGSDELFTWSKEAYDNAYKAFTDAKAKYGTQ